MTKITTPTKLGFERQYSDNSGVELGVYWDAMDEGRQLKIKSGGDEVWISKEDAQLLMIWLTKIASEVNS